MKQPAAATSFYELLGLDGPNVTPDEIKKAYRKAALRNHPDKNGNTPESISKFQDINKANEVLKTPWKKEIYDAFGEDALNMFDQYSQATGADPDDMPVSPLQTIAIACCCFTLLLFLLTAFLSMVAMNADDVIGGSQAWNWYITFSPLLTMDFFLVCIVCAGWSSARDKPEGISTATMLQICCHVAFHFTLIQKLNAFPNADQPGVIGWDRVFAPLMFNEAINVVQVLCRSSRTAYDAAFASGLIADPYIVYVGRNLCSVLFRVILLVLTVLKLTTHDDLTWAEVFVPIWLYVLLEFIVVLYTLCCFTFPADDTGKVLRQSMMARLIIVAVLTTFVTLLVLKLDGKGSYSVVIIALPFFIFSGCYFACCCCVVCCGGGPPQSRGTGTGTDAGPEAAESERTPLNQQQTNPLNQGSDSYTDTVAVPSKRQEDMV